MAVVRHGMLNYWMVFIAKWIQFDFSSIQLAVMG